MRIALATVGTTGDIAPFAALAGRLAARGHDVTAISWPVHSAALARPGVRVESAGPHADPSRIAAVAVEAAGVGPMQQVAILRDFHLADGETHLRRLRELLDGYDVVVLHSIHVLAHAAACDIRARWATAVFDPVLQPTARRPPPGMPHLGPMNRLLWRALDWALARTGRPLDEVLERAGSAQRGIPLFRARSSLLHLIACSPVLIDVPDDLPPTTRVTGPWRDTDAPAHLPVELEAFMAVGAPPVVITFGSMRGLPDAVLTDGVRRMLEAGARVVVQGSVDAVPSSPNLMRTGPVDHRSLLPRAALVVHHGGAGTTHAVASAGVPSVVVPHVGDQRYWADRLHRLGVAPKPLLVGKTRGDLLADTVLESRSRRSLREAASALAERMRGEDGADVAASHIEAIAKA